MTILLCDILKGETTTACQRSLERERDQTIMNTHATAPSLYYDALATAAAEKGLINLTAWNRSSVREAIYHHQEDELQLAPQDLELNCPSNQQLQALLNMSLELEAKYMPEFAHCPHQREEHREGFENYVAQKVYCWVDTDAVLDQIEWKNFFQKFSGG